MIYVDDMKAPFEGKIMCHMLSDNIEDPEELHIFAEKLGLKRSWFQNKRTDSPHYDIALSKKSKAIKLGAKEITQRQMLNLVHLHRLKKVCECQICKTYPITNFRENKEV